MSTLSCSFSYSVVQSVNYFMNINIKSNDRQEIQCYKNVISTVDSEH